MRLSNGEKLAAAHPRTFEIPDKQERESLQPGDFAKMIFDEQERMWVKVAGRRDNGQYYGHLDNHPVLVTLSRGDEVEFSPKHVIAIFRKEEIDALRKQ